MLATQSPQSSPARTPADPAPVDVTPLFPRGVYEDIDNCAEVIAAQDDLDQRRRAGAPTGACLIVEDEQLETLARRWNIRTFCIGHQSVPEGIRQDGPKLIAINSDRANGVVIDWNLEDEPSPERLLRAAVRLQSIAMPDGSGT